MLQCLCDEIKAVQYNVLCVHNTGEFSNCVTSKVVLHRIQLQ